MDPLAVITFSNDMEYHHMMPSGPAKGFYRLKYRHNIEKLEENWLPRRGVPMGFRSGGLPTATLEEQPATAWL